MAAFTKSEADRAGQERDESEDSARRLWKQLGISPKLRLPTAEGVTEGSLEIDCSLNCSAKVLRLDGLLSGQGGESFVRDMQAADGGSWLRDRRFRPRRLSQFDHQS